MSDLLSSVSAVVVADGDVPDEAFLLELIETLATQFLDVELIIVANGLDSEAALRMKEMLLHLPDTTVHFLGRRVDLGVAQVAGMENAVSDYVLLIAPLRAAVITIPDLVAAARQSYDDVIGLPPRQHGRTGLYGAMERGFFHVLSRLTNTTVLPDPVPVRLLSRPASQYVTSLHNAEMLLRSAAVAPAFPSKTVEAAGLVGKRRTPRPLHQAMSKALSVLISSTSAPVRIVSYTAMVAAVIAVLYSIYVLLSYFVRDEIAPGWASVSLQLSLMMIFFSILFGMLAEYILQIHSSTSRSRRPIATRELKSQLTRRQGRLNIIDKEGRYTYAVGAPTDFQPGPKRRPGR